MPRKAPQVRSKVVPYFGVLGSEGDRRAWKPPDAALQRTPVPMSCAWIAGQEKSSTSLVVWPFQAAHTGASVGLPHPTLPLHPARLASLLPPRHLAPEGGVREPQRLPQAAATGARAGTPPRASITAASAPSFMSIRNCAKYGVVKRARAYRLSRRYCPRASSLVCARARRGARMRARPRPRRARGAAACLRCSHPRLVPYVMPYRVQSSMCTPCDDRAPAARGRVKGPC